MFSFVVALAFLAVAFGQTYFTTSLSSGGVCGGSPYINAYVMNVCYPNANTAGQWVKATYGTATSTITVTTTTYSNSGCTTSTGSSASTYSSVCTPTGSQSTISAITSSLPTSTVGYLSSV